MRLHHLLETAAIPVPALVADREIRAVSGDSRRLPPAALFVGVPGAHVDGGDYWAASLAGGAAVAVIGPRAARKHPPGPADPVVVVEDPAACLGRLASAFWGHPSRHLQLIGVTGTNGKTTTTHWIEHLSTALGTPTALLGTLENRWPGTVMTASHTTAPADMVHGHLAQAVADGVQRAAMEVSSHALAQQRAAGLAFAGAVFTNLSQDHLDFHGDMESYFQAKARLFAADMLHGQAVINCEDHHGRRLHRELGSKAWGCRLLDPRQRDQGPPLDRNGELVMCDLAMGAKGVEGRLISPMGEGRFRSPMLGRFNLMNLLQAVGALLSCGAPLGPLLEHVPRFGGVPGRMESIGAPDLTVVVDYAHTPDGLTSALQALRPFVAGRLICVFGCGGERDRGKRPLMGAAAAELADELVITSDNPRTEDPEGILEEICAGLPTGIPHHRELDRRLAIHRAVVQAVAGDTVLIAGKGHERVQIIGHEQRPFDDRRVAAAAIAER
ncbi:MAG: UDP-N-acetylmuramoyl-L-alanyl-D-glutamate--2,6-diaminopimelate ligase [Synechococcus sp. SB0662_bin_45]|nr:UDP-N-acetylmuramoyl-L-alanyl-D-glutamate--2,6-diaminopimelate ligase [Synechococcus sp. SB0668_bin_13]MYE21469.1 UDP-N-acetylmuramoyl-L-alanyl-D-glutamate--2,6-diaminopimelate ligase [Synechococcus sp. SB0662_bin_45]